MSFILKDIDVEFILTYEDVFVKEMMELASQEVVDGVEGKIERESLLVKK